MAFPINAKQILIHVSIFIEDEIQTGSFAFLYRCMFHPSRRMTLFGMTKLSSFTPGMQKLTLYEILFNDINIILNL